tara:strand:+ start:472 stop:912 length:441 start_codon:yes stop_codon:yes gene_type:complete
MQRWRSEMVTTFDFDSTLTRVRLDDDYGLRYMGPNKPVIEKLKQHARNGDVVYIVTSRSEHLEDNLPELDEYGRIIVHAVEDFIDEHGLRSYIEGVHFTNGKLKASTLNHFGSTLHYDDDTEEIAALHPDTESVHINPETGNMEHA